MGFKAMTTKESMTNEEIAEVLYDAGPRFEACNEINRPAWIKKIKEALDLKDFLHAQEIESLLSWSRKAYEALKTIDHLVQGYGPNFDTRKLAQKVLTTAPESVKQ